MALDLKEIREQSTDRIREILAEILRQRFDHKKSLATGEEMNPHETRDMRRQAARVRTLLHAIELVSARSGVDEDAAREALARNSWDIARATACLRADTHRQAAVGTEVAGATAAAPDDAVGATRAD